MHRYNGFEPNATVNETDLTAAVNLLAATLPAAYAADQASHDSQITDLYLDLARRIRRDSLAEQQRQKRLYRRSQLKKTEWPYGLMVHLLPPAPLSSPLPPRRVQFRPRHAAASNDGGNDHAV